MIDPTIADDVLVSNAVVVANVTTVDVDSMLGTYMVGNGSGSGAKTVCVVVVKTGYVTVGTGNKVESSPKIAVACNCAEAATGKKPTIKHEIKKRSIRIPIR
jgi:hypothetical protein